MTTTVVVTAVQAIQKTPERNCISTRSGIVGSLVGVVIDQKNKRKFCVKRSPSRDRYFDCIHQEILSDSELFSCIRKCSKCTVRHANQVFSSIVNPFKEMKASIIFALKSQDLNKRALENAIKSQRRQFVLRFFRCKSFEIGWYSTRGYSEITFAYFGRSDVEGLANHNSCDLISGFSSLCS